VTLAISQKLIIALSLFTAQTSFAQAPQNPEACAQLRERTGRSIGDLILKGGMKPQEALQVVEGFNAIHRLTQHPCFLPPGVPPNPACTRLGQQTFQLISDLVLKGGMLMNEAMPHAMKMLEVRRSLGDPCFMPSPPRPSQPPMSQPGFHYIPQPRSGGTMTVIPQPK
jgi:hypothetical protein